VDLAGQDLGVGVIELKAEVKHVLCADSLEHKAGRRPSDVRAQCPEVELI
jgi:hypothetical protein